MATDRYRVEIDTSAATRSLAALRGTVAGLAGILGSAFTVRELVTTISRFEDLRSSLSSVYGDVATGARAFEQIKQFATESIFGVEELTSSVIKLKSAGLNPTIEQLRLFGDIAANTTDKVGTLQAITDLYARTTGGGLGLEDLNRLQDRGVPVFKILADTAKLSRDEISRIGQSAEGAQAILAILGNELQRIYGGGQAQGAGNLSRAFSQLGDAIKNAFDAIGAAGLSQALNEVAKNITNVVENNKDLIRSIGQGLGNAIKFVNDNARILVMILGVAFSLKVAGTIVAMAAAVFRFAEGLKAAATAGAVLQGVTGVGLAKVAAGVAASAGIVFTINEILGDATTGVDDLNEKLGELGKDGPLSGNIPQGSNQALIDALNTINEIRNRTNSITKDNDKNLRTYRESTQLLLESLKFQQEQIGLTTEQVQANERIRNFTEDYQKRIRELNEQLIELNKEPAKNADLIARVNEAVAATTAEYQAQLPIVTSVSNELLRQELAMKNIKEANEALLDFFDDMDNATQDASRSFQQLNMNPLEKQVDDISAKINRQLQGEIKSLRRLQTNENMPQINSLIEGIQKRAQEAITAQTQLAEQSYVYTRQFSTGWSKALRDYTDEATNAAKTAESIFNKTTQGMEDMIVNFAKTGKFEFKGFINSILEDLLRSQVRGLIAQVFNFGGGNNMGGSGGGLISGLGNLLGFANGGIIPTNSPVLVGERGPEIISGAAGRVVTPNNQLGASNVTYNINAVDARSFKELLAEDPAYIYGLTMVGSKGVPVRR